MNDKKRLGQRYITSRPGHSITAYGDILLEAVENLLEGERARGQGTLCPELWSHQAKAERNHYGRSARRQDYKGYCSEG